MEEINLLGLQPPEQTLACPVPAPRGDRLKVSLSLIVKDKEHNLPACLGSVADLVDEVIVVDTGSTDRTREVAARLGARVVAMPWLASGGHSVAT
jgi:cellulose synthase/poly-beta-1,6-N-acetylglucosamine synthase-like glycosyltransferase